jgi:hypothetical protein
MTYQDMSDEQLMSLFGEWLSDKVQDDNRHISNIDGFLADYSCTNKQIKLIQSAKITVIVERKT